MQSANHWKSLVTLAPGQTLMHQGHKASGFMADEDIDTYAVVGLDGVKAGEVVVRDHTAVKGFKRSVRVTHTDAAGKQLLDTRYDVRRD